jgi:hypothetical protein
MMNWRILAAFWVVLMIVLAACAIGDSPEAMLTQRPPVTLNAPPTPIFEGSCDLTADLSSWLQNSVFIRRDFLDSMYGAALMNQLEMRNEVIRMAAWRDQLSTIPAPECAVEAHLILLGAMTQAVDAFQAFANGDSPDLGTTVVDVRAQIDTVTALQDSLTLQLDQQYQATQTAVGSPPPP